jgi:hypothetical protein
VVRQGFNATQVELGLQGQLLELVSLGYNTKEVFYGPEFGADPVLESLHERKWDGVIVGFGSRGDPTLAGTIHFEREYSSTLRPRNPLLTTLHMMPVNSTGTLNAIRETSPKTVFMFNYSPTSTVEAVQRAFPLSGCDDHRPGTNYVSSRKRAILPHFCNFALMQAC